MTLACFRAALALAAAFLSGTAFAAEPRGQVEVAGDIVTVGDLFADAGDVAGEPVFYAPAPGQTVEIGPNFLHRVALGFNLDWQPGAGMARVIVSRAATPIGTDALAPVVMAAIAQRIGAGFDAERTQISFDSGISTQFLPVGVEPAMTGRDLTFDPRSQRFSLIVDIAAGTPYAASVRASGRLRSVVLAPVLVRAVSRDELIGPADVQWMEIEADNLSATVILDADRMIGFVARRALSPNQPVAQADLQAPLAVRRGETVTMVLQTGTLTLTAQGQALQDGSSGDVIRVVNVQSSRTIEATVEGPGVVRVTAPASAVAG